MNVGTDGQKKQQAFGLISASLGKKSNIDEVVSKVIKPLLEIMKRNDDVTGRKKSYLAARQIFLDQLSVVQKLRAELDELVIEEKKACSNFWRGRE